MIDVYVSGPSIDIGRQGENDARCVYFDLSQLIATYGDGNATLVHMRPSDQAPYICETSVIDNYLAWTPSNTDTAYAGAGKCELRWVVGETLAKSIIYTTTIAPSITGDSVIPDPYQSWIDAMDASIVEHIESVAEDALAAYLETNAQEMGTLTITVGGSSSTYDGSGNVTIILPVYSGGTGTS